jgi:Fe-S cluster assembly protein SufD
MTSASAVAGPGVDRYRLEFEKLSRRSAEPSWLRQRRRAAFERFADRGFPTSRDEAWRQTSVARIVGTSFGRPSSHGVPASLPREPLRGVEVLPLRQALEQTPDRLEAYLAPRLDDNASAFADLNTALHEDGVVVFLAPGTVADEPIQIAFASAGVPAAATVTHPRVLIVAGRGSRATIVESYVGERGQEYFTNAVTEVHVEPGAQVEHYRLQQESESAFHIGRLAADVGRDGRLTARSFSFGAALSRLDVDLTLSAEGGDGTLEGLFLASRDRHTDVHTRVDHAAVRGTSRQLYKGILDGHGRGVFHGLVVVRPGAQKTDAVQNNRNLLLSRDALVSSTPQLEILADDVKCKHGSTTGQLDAAAVFYLRSRGISEAEARGLLTRAFAGELVARISVASVRAAVEAELGARLGGGPMAVEDGA